MFTTIEEFIRTYPLVTALIAIVTLLLAVMLILSIVKRVTRKLVWLLVAATIGVPIAPLLAFRLIAQ